MRQPKPEPTKGYYFVREALLAMERNGIITRRQANTLTLKKFGRPIFGPTGRKK